METLQFTVYKASVTSYQKSSNHWSWLIICILMFGERSVKSSSLKFTVLKVGLVGNKGWINRYASECCGMSEKCARVCCEYLWTFHISSQIYKEFHTKASRKQRLFVQAEKAEKQSCSLGCWALTDRRQAQCQSCWKHTGQIRNLLWNSERSEVRTSISKCSYCFITLLGSSSGNACSRSSVLNIFW